MHASAAKLRGSCSLELQLPVHRGPIGTTLFSCSGSAAIHPASSSDAAPEADPKICCLMRADSKKEHRVLHSALLVATANSEAGADDYLFTHAHRRDRGALTCSAVATEPLRASAGCALHFRDFNFPLRLAEPLLVPHRYNYITRVSWWCSARISYCICLHFPSE